MRSLLFVLVLAACGSSTPATTTPATTGEPTGGEAPPVAGATGLKDLVWGADEAAILAAYPQATQNDEGGYWYMGTAEGMQAVTVFSLDADGLQSVRIEFAEGLPTMDACSEKWRQLRTSLDGRFGASQADNLAAYWSTETTTMELACNPNESGAGVLSLVYANPATAN